MIGRTLSIYFANRFAKTVIAAFLFVFALIYVVDLVELLRRSGDTPRANGLMMAGLSFLRTPTIAEQALPFAVLFGAMIAFLNLSRRLELVVARAAGVSIWQILTAPLIVVTGIGIFAITVFNPLSTAMKQRSDTVENSIFGGPTNPWGDVWLRQRSVDGQAIIHAGGKDPAGTQLTNVEVFNFDDKGNFVERVDASSGELHDGYWEFHDAKIVTPGFEPTSAPKYLLATTLTPREVSQAFVAAETVSFWNLPGLVQQTEQAGLDPTAYRLRFQELLALPLTLAAMVLVAACFSLRFFRMGGIEVMVSGGIAAGFVLYVVTKVVNDLGSAGFISAAVAGWSPGFVGCLFGVYVLLQQEDG